jgi:formate-dependent nitrite reductase cytochrome c552 subunit
MPRMETTDGKLKARTVRGALETARLLSELGRSIAEEGGEDLVCLGCRANDAARLIRNEALAVGGLRIAVFSSDEEGGDK